MGHYKSNVRDLEFNLFEVFNRQEILGTGPYSEVDQDTAREILHEVGRLAENELAESLLDSDRNPPVFDPATNSVTIPASFTKSYKAYLDAGWWRLDIGSDLGAQVGRHQLTGAVRVRLRRCAHASNLRRGHRAAEAEGAEPRGEGPHRAGGWNRHLVVATRDYCALLPLSSIMDVTGQ